MAVHTCRRLLIDKIIENWESGYISYNDSGTSKIVQEYDTGKIIFDTLYSTYEAYPAGSPKYSRKDFEMLLFMIGHVDLVEFFESQCCEKYR